MKVWKGKWWVGFGLEVGEERKNSEVNQKGDIYPVAVVGLI